jgi:hypothetical protein
VITVGQLFAAEAANSQSLKVDVSAPFSRLGVFFSRTSCLFAVPYQFSLSTMFNHFSFVLVRNVTLIFVEQIAGRGHEHGCRQLYWKHHRRALGLPRAGRTNRSPVMLFVFVSLALELLQHVDIYGIH